MIGKDHVLFLKKILKFKILKFLGLMSVVYIIPKLTLRFFDFYTIAITRLFTVITYNNIVTVQSGLPIFFVLDMTKYTYTNKYTYAKFLADQLYFAKVFKVTYEQKTYFFTLYVVSGFSFFQFFFDISMNIFLLRLAEGIMRSQHWTNQNKQFNKSNIMNLLPHYSS